MEETKIIINGQQLTTGQAMAVRVAISDFYSQMHDPNALGDDDHGLLMTKAYRERLAEVIRMMA